ncbi:MAG: DoxX family protein, partial [Saprospiraceae bacterium]|nr:DoxX family protein [Saprospiraceae bacterium]
ICAALLVAGLATRLAAIPLMITMAVAFFLVHADDPVLDREVAMLYLVVYAVIYLIGPGRFSLDQLIFGIRKR